MTDEELKETYTSLNNSFKKTLVFHVGVNAGFFSEYNNMVLAVLYCLKHKIKFMLYSDDANFKIKNGYSDLFVPFCTEVHEPAMSTFNFRWYDKNNLKLWPKVEALKKQLGINYFTQDLWRLFCNDFTQYSYYSIPELEIKGRTQDATRQVLRFLWKFNPSTQALIDTCTASVKIPDIYTGIHIRGGDKIIEANLVNPDNYINAAIADNCPKSAFVLTDDYRIFNEVCSKYPDWSFFTLCGKDEHGYFHDDYMKLSNEEKFSKLINLLASVDVLSKSARFYGTYTSNPGMFLGMKMPKGHMTGLDRKSWVTRW